MTLELAVVIATYDSYRYRIRHCYCCYIDKYCCYIDMASCEFFAPIGVFFAILGRYFCRVCLDETPSDTRYTQNQHQSFNYPHPEYHVLSAVYQCFKNIT